MERQGFFPYSRWFQLKDNNRNLVSAFFHMITITLVTTSLVRLSWFQISGSFCTPHLSIYTFFTFGYGDSVKTSYIDVYKNQEFRNSVFNWDYDFFGETLYRCITSKVANIMRIIILLCFMAIIFSLIGFFLDIIGPKNKVYDCVRRHSLPGSCSALWIIGILILCYYVASLIEDSFKDVYSQSLVEVNFEYGFYAIAAAGIMTLTGIVCNLLFTYIHRSSDASDRRLLGNEWEDVETFNMPPPPPYSAPPPPYTP